MKIKSMWIEAEEWAPGQWTPSDDNTDVVVTLDDDSKWVASFFSYRNISSLVEKDRRTGECLSGRYFWASDMILVDEVSRKRIEEVTAYLVEQRYWEFTAIFQKFEDSEE
ncbi:MAG: hypothetical protein JXB13_11455 [Phycisphaerae bacterium]|nr:hypothetical protein [Phycisphaerae bacterium]